MKNIFAQVIGRGEFDLEKMITTIDSYHIEGKLTDDDRLSLLEAARVAAKPQMDAGSEVARLWVAVKGLQQAIAELRGEGAGKPDGSAAPEYAQPTGAHDAYYAGAVVKYKGKTYVCIAPEGVACVWSPEVMPGYWEVRQ